MKFGRFILRLVIFILALIAFLLLYIFVLPLTAVAPSVKISSLLPAAWFPEEGVRKATLIREASVGEATVFVEVAASAKERAVGLSGRDSLAENRGMLFLFPEKTRPAFWMKGVSFPIDIIWIADNRAIGFNEGVLPEPGASPENLNKYTPPEDVDSAVEVNSGFIARNKISVGDKVVIK